MALAFGIAVIGPIRGINAAPEERTLSFHNIHTNEDISIVYKRGGAFVPEALEKLNHFMRDWRRNITIKIDPALFDIIWKMHTDLGSKKPINLICGHRSVATNEGLRRTRGGQARGSKHITGQAADIQFPDIPTKQIRNAGLILERGGVGYYPSSSIPFVHVDTGNVRHWPRLPRQELAVLFPSGHSKHVPSDGRPITKADFRIALARLQERGGELPYFLARKTHPGAPQTELASLDSGADETAKPVAAIAQAKPKPQMSLASLTPSLGFSRQEQEPKPSLIKPLAKDEPAKTIVESRVEQTSLRPDNERLTVDEILGNEPAPGEGSAKVELDEDEIADDQEYQPYPVVPFMSDTPIASMTFDGGNSQALSKVHLLFGETHEMLDGQFQPGLQVAEIYWAQRFRGTAVNTALKRIKLDTPQREIQTAQNR